MRLYPDVPSRRTATILWDLAFLAGLGILLWIAIYIHQGVNRLAVLGSRISNVASGLPPPLSGPVSNFGSTGVSHVHSLATIASVIAFAVPAGLLLWVY